MEPLTGLVVYGPLGIWALASTIGLVSLYRDVGRLRDNHATALENLGKRTIEQVQALGVTHAQNMREQAERYDRQIAELHQRTFTIVSTISDKMSTLADTLTRRPSK